MKKITQFLLMTIALVFSTVAIAQSTVTGTITDSETNTPLPGVNVIEKGTNNGVSSDFDGNFTLKTRTSDAVIVISYVGFLTREISISGDIDLGSIVLESSSFGLDEINIIASVAVDRKTPVAVSTVRAEEIQLKLGSQEFPEILKSTPGVFATRAGGGFGDGRINLRGFGSVNVAVLINGIPVNDMENGRVFWSNWAGLGGVTSAMQVQRGLGASKLAVPSIGGTINIITKTTDVETGGRVFADVGNDGRRKYGLMYSTGLMDNGFAVTVAADKTDGNGYVDGTEFTSVSYFVNISNRINDNHKLSFSAFGAKQNHGQRQNRHLISTYRNSERGIKYNSDWGFKQGQVTHVEDNFYHKPQLSLNHYWTISDKTSVSTAAYGSWGSGGGGGTIGSDLDAGPGFEGDGRFKFSSSDYRIGNFGPLDLDRIVEENIANGANGSSAALRASRNDHSWYGILSTLKTDLSDNLVFLGGIDWRYYKGFHFREVTDLLGGQFIINDDDVNNPLNPAQVGDKVDYQNNGIVGWIGLYGQLEYTKDKLNAFISLSGSNTSYKREDFFNYTPDDPLQITDRFNFFGFSAKGGANYNINGEHNVFANIGYLEKAAGFDAVFLQFDNEHINEDAENQKITSFELGYGYRSEKFAANVNLYSTKWEDRTLTRSFQQPDGTFASANILGVNALHNGIELDFTYKASDKLTFRGMASFGDWTWQDDLEDIQIFDEEQNLIQTVNIFIKDLHVGDAAQTTMALGLDFELMSKTRLIIDYNYFDNLYALYDPNDRGTDDGPDAWKLPDYGTFDIILRHGFKFGDFDAAITARLFNAFDTEYIADALDGGDSDAATSLVWFGNGRSFNIGVNLKF